MGFRRWKRYVFQQMTLGYPADIASPTDLWKPCSIHVGGVGKTTTSCCLGVQLARTRKKVLIVSTDPAHNLSDAFCQKIGREPTPIQGFDNLSAMEIDANQDMDEMQRQMEEEEDQSGGGGISNIMGELSNSIPGIDEAMSFSELMKQVQNLDFDVVVFDTAPTGHTLRLLSFPTILEKALGKVMELKDRFGGLIGQATALMGGGQNPAQAQDALLGKLEETRAVINKVNDAFQDPALTTFVSRSMPTCPCSVAFFPGLCSCLFLPIHARVCFLSST